MKLQIINLDPEDDQVSAREKLAWAKAPRAVLVWPRRGRVLTRRIDLTLLQRQADRLGMDIGLVSYDPEVLRHAAGLGIPTFDTPDDLPEERWQRRPARSGPARPPPARAESLAGASERIPGRLDTIAPLPARAGGFVTALTAAVLLAAGALILPRARITLSPERRIVAEEMLFILDPDLDEAGPADRIPAQRITLRVAGEARRETTSSTWLPTSSADGLVVFTNLTTEAISIPEGTGVRASRQGVRFLTQESVDLAPGPASIGEARILAAEPGVAGNLPAGAIDAVEGSLGFLVAVTSPEATVGGEQERHPAVGAADLARLRQDLSEQLLERSLAQFEAALAPDQQLAEGTVRISQTIHSRYDHQLGQPTAILSLEMEVEVEGLAYQLSLAQDLALRRLSDQQPEEAIPVPGSLRLLPRREGSESPAGDAPRVSYMAQASFVDRLDFDQVRRAARGLSVDRAADRLMEQLNLRTPPRLRVIPSWFPWLPWLPAAIEVRWIWDSS